MDRKAEPQASSRSRRWFLGKRRARDLDTAERRYRSLVERGPLAVYEWEFGSPGRWRYVSPQIEELIGYRPEELLADPELWFRLIHDDDRDTVLLGEARSQAVAAGERVEYRMRHREGRTVWVRDDAVAVTDEGPPFFRGVLSDVTSQKVAEAEVGSINAELERRVEERTAELHRANAELVEARDEALRASRVQSEFLSRASHELRTPLNAILGFGQLLRGGQLGEFERDAVEHIVHGGERLLELVNDVLDISAVRSGRLALSIEPIAVPDVVEEAVGAGREAAGDVVRVELRPGATPAFVLGDRQRLAQALTGIVSHAVTFQRSGGLLTVGWEAGPGPRTTITIVDSGAGIDATQVDRLFASLAESAYASAPTSAQLRLPLAKALIEAMGGSISVETEPGRGSVVSVILRSAEDPTARLSDGPPSPSAGERAASILYIDDNLTNLDLVQQILVHRPGTTLLRAMLAEVGLRLAAEHRPDLVLLDLHLPDLSGEEALAKLRAADETKDLPVIVLSSEQRRRPSQILRSLGIAGYLSKPLDVGEFLATVDRALADGDASGP